MNEPSERSGERAARRRGWRPWRFVRGRPWTVLSLLIFLVAMLLLLHAGLRVANAVLLGFDLAALVFLGIFARLFNQATPSHMRSQAQALDTGRWGVLWGGVLLSAVVL